uniref:Uncharacterized protein n=1 Tax=Arundo donax TaxID=35708 RepID=A0A0A9H8U2_ARUDO
MNPKAITEPFPLILLLQMAHICTPKLKRMMARLIKGRNNIAIM